LKNPFPAGIDASDANALRERLSVLEQELSAVYAALTGVRAGVSLPGLHLLLETGTSPVLVPAVGVLEIIPLLETTPLPGGPAWIVGTFLYRGRRAYAVDLSAALGGLRSAGRLDSHVVVVGGEVLFGLVVDRVRTLVDAPTLIAGPAEKATREAGLRMFAGTCRIEERTVPLLAIPTLTSWLRGHLE